MVSTEKARSIVVHGHGATAGVRLMDQLKAYRAAKEQASLLAVTYE
jgi:hypothetical protein